MRKIIHINQLGKNRLWRLRLLQLIIQRYKGKMFLIKLKSGKFLMKWGFSSQIKIWNFFNRILRYLKTIVKYLSVTLYIKQWREMRIMMVPKQKFDIRVYSLLKDQRKRSIEINLKPVLIHLLQERRILLWEFHHNWLVMNHWEIKK